MTRRALLIAIVAASTGCADVPVRPYRYEPTTYPRRRGERAWRLKPSRRR